MKKITVQDCEEIRKKFEEYCLTAQQSEFPILLIMDLMMQGTLERIRKTGKVENQVECRAMFRVVLKLTGGDATEYQEVEG